MTVQVRRAKSATARPRVWSPASQVEGVSHHATKASRLAAYYQRLHQMQHAAQVARLTAVDGEAVLPKSPPTKPPRAACSGAGASVEKLAGWGGDGTDGTKLPLCCNEPFFFVGVCSQKSRPVVDSD
jgi:hypothetical protein